MSCPRQPVILISQIVKLLGAALALATGALLFATALSTSVAGQVPCMNGVCTCTTASLTSGNGEDLLVYTGTCTVHKGQYKFHNVNIYGGGELLFADDGDTDFWAESILIENNGSLVAGSASALGAYKSRLTLHLYGKSDDDGIDCKSQPQPPQPDKAPCGIPDTLWFANTFMADHMNMGGTMPMTPWDKNKNCTPATGILPGNDCFYQYEVQQSQHNKISYFGHKVLAVSYGGTLELFGSHGVTYRDANHMCDPKARDTECNPAFTGTSWVRLTGVSDPVCGVPSITVNRAVHWKQDDHIVVTTTDYLPSHSEEMILTEDANGMCVKVKNADPAQNGFRFPHYASVTALPASMPGDIGPQDDPNLPTGNGRLVDTRAAVALLTRNIQIVSEGDTLPQTFAQMPDNYYFGGHTIVRQGFAGYRVQGVEFYHLGQGGEKGRYPVHFHMARKTPQPTPTPADPTPAPLDYLKDSSIHDSMTRFVTVHATEGVYVARNVGYKSIGHGYYLEDATEVNNKFYGNIGILAQAAIQDKVHNPRQVPGILADKTGGQDNMPYSSDVNHPSVFWISNGWNEFQYNMAAGAATCGACYWWVPAGNSGPSQYEHWDSYASLQIDPGNRITPPVTNMGRGGLSPLQTFVGNSCVAAMSSFQMNETTGDCLGVQVNPAIIAPLSAVNNPHAPQPSRGGWEVYYPVLTGLHNPTLCPDVDCSPHTKDCNSADAYGLCTVTHLDHYTTSFNFSQTNFSAVWIRKGWDLVTNSAITDIQTGGLNFVTGGGYTRSDVSQGEWLVARNNVFIGHTQPSRATDPNANPYAEEVGPFNPFTAALKPTPLKCDDASADHCAYADGGVSFNLNPFPGQKFFNIYDGPAHQTHNAYVDITVSKLTCTPGQDCKSDPVPYGRNPGVLKDQPQTYCYIPNAAIAWKQPNGFYYPPAFHSNNLWFSNVDIRHFVVEPLFSPIKPLDADPFQQDQMKVDGRYCTHTSDMFSASFNNIDRQTVLNDDDGTLTGLLGARGGTEYPTISINEDDFFNAPLTTPECLSDVGVIPKANPKLVFATATTSPYEWLTTAIVSDCGVDRKVECRADPTAPTLWAHDCGNSACRGIPLYREYLTDSESPTSRPQIRMMGQDTSQRSTLSLNHGAYYIDTTQDCTAQGGCPKCTKFKPNGECESYENRFRPTIFQADHTYYVYFGWL
jgi:G8 domain